MMMMILKKKKITVNNSNYVNFIKKNNLNQKLVLIQLLTILGIDVPRFCFHNKLSIAGNCRLCIIEILNTKKVVVSCGFNFIQDMSIFTETKRVSLIRNAILEFLLINHPLDCPICDQGGECDLQDHTMLFGTLRSRFYDVKRSVKDKNYSNLIKLSMNRCIHCTRCIRFLKEISNEYSLGLIGRGYKMEISTYLNKNINNELSANIIDLCPVGALTLKFDSFNSRSWELDSLESIDILDNMCSNIRIDFRGKKIIRILPRTNEFLNEEWITDKIRFSFDGIDRQRLIYPMLKLINFNFINVSWYTAFNFLQDIGLKSFELFSKKFNYFKKEGFLGNFLCSNSIVLFKNLLNNLGSNVFYLNNDFKINSISDFRQNYSFNLMINEFKFIDLCFFLGTNLRLEMPLLNIKFKHFIKKKIFFSLGLCLNLNYNLINIGNNFKIFLNILKGKHWSCNYLLNSKKPVILITDNNYIKDLNSFFFFSNLFFIKKFTKFFNKYWFGLNFLMKNITNTHSCELNLFSFHKNNLKKKKNFSFFLDYFYEKKINFFNGFSIFQGHHGNNNVLKNNLIFPSLNFLESNNFYLNSELYLQNTNKINKFNNLIKTNSQILLMLKIFFFYKNYYEDPDIKFWEKNNLIYLDTKNVLCITSSVFLMKKKIYKNLSNFLPFSFSFNLFKFKEKINFFFNQPVFIKNIIINTKESINDSFKLSFFYEITKKEKKNIKKLNNFSSQLTLLMDFGIFLILLLFMMKFTGVGDGNDKDIDKTTNTTDTDNTHNTNDNNNDTKDTNKTIKKKKKNK